MHYHSSSKYLSKINHKSFYSFPLNQKPHQEFVGRRMAKSSLSFYFTSSVAPLIVLNHVQNVHIIARYEKSPNWVVFLRLAEDLLGVPSSSALILFEGFHQTPSCRERDDQRDVTKYCYDHGDVTERSSHFAFASIVF